MRKERFKVEEGSDLVAENRIFKNKTMVFDDLVGIALSCEEIVEILNQDDYFSSVFDFLQNKIWYCQAEFKKTGDNFFKAQEKFLRDIRDELKEPRCNSQKYMAFLKEYLEEK